MARRRRWLLAGGGVLLLTGAVLAWQWRLRGAAEGPRSPYRTVAVDRGPIVARVTATGTLSAIVTVQVGSQVSGRIQQLFVDFNSAVSKGQVIAKIDPQLFEAAVEQARANLMAAEGNLARARAQAADALRQAARAEQLATRQLVATAERDTAAATAEAASAGVQAAGGSVAQARAALNQARINLAYTTIVSPTDGVVISRDVDVGQTVAASLQAPTLFVIAEDLRKMQVDTNVAEADVGRLRAGMPASFTVDAHPNEPFYGAVRQIRNAPQTVQNVVTYDAVIDVDNPALKLKPGMTANVTFVHADRDQALRVPNAALRFRPPAAALAAAAPSPKPNGQGNGRGSGRASARASERPTSGAATQPAAPPPPPRRELWVLRAGQARAVSIATGVTDGRWTEVLDGALAVGDEVIIEAVPGGVPRAAGGAGMGGGPPPRGMRSVF
ncbi:MAG: efflux RND transporter periplasmic adaptor subunit [Proteobacteria bacterium]|nr:efflux RND transporter periplasmic adaptor subunit [Pseudomonadota bacterium]